MSFFLFFCLVFWARPVMLWISLFRLLSKCPTDFGLLCPYFHLFQGIFWFLPLSHCWPIHCLITCYLASTSLHVFQCSSFRLLLVIDFYFHSTVVREDDGYDFNLLEFIETFLCPHVWLIPGNVAHVLEKYLYSVALGRNALKITIKFIWSCVPF